MKKDTLTASYYAFLHLFVSAFVLCFTFLLSSNAIGATFNVNNSTGLLSALELAQAGDFIELGDGDYKGFTISDRHFSDFVTIAPSDGDRRIDVSGEVSINNSSYIRVNGLNVIADGRQAMSISLGSHHIEIKNSDLAGLDQFDRESPAYTQVTTFYAMNVSDASNIHIDGVYGHDTSNAAFLFSDIEDSIIRNNICDWVAGDCFKFSGADGIVFENNVGARNIYSSPTAHVDFVQGQGDVSNSVFRGNIAIMGTRSFQGLFFDDAVFTNLIFENNLIYTVNIRGISVVGSGGNGIVARNNTILIPPTPDNGRGNKASLILLPDNSINENNIVSNTTTKNDVRFDGGNILAQWNDDDDTAYYGLYYQNATSGAWATLEDFRPVLGSVAENEKGAFCRILEVLDGTPCYKLDDSGASSTFMVIPLVNDKIIVAPL